MPITSETEGDLVELALRGKSSKYSHIIHGCNCFCTMGAGIAYLVRKKWPGAYKADLKTTHGDPTKLGDFSYYYDKGVDLFVVNAYTQYRYGRGRLVDYEAVASVFTKLNKFVKEKDRPVGIPRIGAGLAGGHWEAIETIINLTTPNLDIELVHLGNITYGE